MRKFKIKNKKILIIGVIAVVCIGAGGIFYLKRSSADQDQAVRVQEATAEKGTISNTIVGTGNLALDASDAIQIPTGITVKEVKVSSGDSVSEGDVLATVDTSSVLEAMETVQDSIADVDEKISDCKNGSDTETVKATISGTIQKIYAKKGDSVTDCIAENGALLIVSASDTGDALEITAGSGTISGISVSKGQSVSEGTTLFTISNDENSEKYKALLAERKELTEIVKKLAKMAQTGEITADADGIVGDVNVASSASGTDTTTNSGGNSGSSGGSVSASNMSYSGSTSSNNVSSTTYEVVTLSATTDDNDGEKESDTTQNTDEGSPESGESRETADNNNDASENKDTGEKKETLSIEIKGSGNSSSSSLVVVSPVTGEKPQSGISVSDGSYSGSIVWSPSADKFEAEKTYQAKITLTASAGYTFTSASIAKVETGTVSGITVSEDGNTLTFSITFPKTKSVSGPDTAGDKENSSDAESKAASSDKSGSTSAGSTSTGKVSGGSSSGASAGGSSSGSSSGSSTAASVDSVSSVDEVTAFTLATGDTMLLSVNVDELDINSVAKDQEARVTLDAIQNETYAGTVTRVSESADSSTSGVAKYVVEISVPKDDQMKAGMNASATIVVEEKEDVLTIPVNALQERRGSAFVYTEKDSDGNLSGEVEVTTGLSNGTTVEITEGLSEGDTVYYQKLGNTSGSQEGMKGMYGGKDGFSGFGGSGDMSGQGGRGNMGGDRSGEKPSGASE